ncbi:hypothetical protein [Proteiniborus sp. MB09-C3]|uniref:hypothetical protein n=1 Tax=Proteiniborus sp. MB09-C3 TaxID=3050072 RepID=UPI0025523B71|nr:hypothetical protein [Proteiniborus sp. MB09-C3]WIV11290.1 hypothetical protein QO263_14180 [Proteiniborus sp. MB09-C3]
MFEIILILFVAAYLVYTIAFQIPRRLQKMENKMDSLSMQLKEINLKLVGIINKKNK